MLGEKNPFIFILIYSKMSEYKLVKKLGSCDNFKGLKSMAKVPRHKLFARNKLSAPTVCNKRYRNCNDHDLRLGKCCTLKGLFHQFRID